MLLCTLLLLVKSASSLTSAALRLELSALRTSMERDDGKTVHSAAAARGVSVRDLVQRSILASRYKLALDACGIGASTVCAGRGLFALRDVEAGELLTIYPADALITFDPARTKRGVMWAEHVPEGLRDAAKLADVWVEYELAPYEKSETGYLYSIIGIPDLDGDAAYAGHFINDGAALVAEGAAALDRYRADSASAANTDFEALEELHCGVVATRRIAEGEEILASYGANYWESRL